MSPSTLPKEITKKRENPTENNWNIVYLSYEAKPGGRSYVGKHSTDNLNDGYFGSYRDSSYSPDSRIILGYYKTAQAALLAEIQWQKVFNVVEDEHFANRSYQSSGKFLYDWTGKARSEENVRNQIDAQNRKEVRQKKSKALKGRPLTDEHILKIKISNLETHKDPEVIARKSKASKEVHSRPEVLEAYSRVMKGRRWWVDPNGRRKKSFEKPEGNWQQGTKWKET